MDEHQEDLPQREDAYRSPWRSVMFIFIALVVASAAIYGIYRMTSDGDSDDAGAAAASTPNVVASDTDEVVTEIRQDPSIRLFSEEGMTYVENDGNVTMSSIVVVDGADATVCDLGTISPGDRQECAGATDALQPLKATGSGPQGQPAESTLE